jgi:hypothetical protein
MKPLFCILCACLMLSGCVAFQAVEASKPFKVSNDITVDPQIDWARPGDLAAINTGGGTLWTVDGLGLDEMRFLTDIAQGKPLLRVSGVDTTNLGHYESAMLPDDVMDLLAATLGKAGNQQVRAANLRPAPFGSAPGFRFDFGYLTKDGLQMKGTALMAQRNKKLDLIIFVAPSEYYYDHYAPIVDRIFASVKLAEPMAARRGS